MQAVSGVVSACRQLSPEPEITVARERCDVRLAMLFPGTLIALIGASFFLVYGDAAPLLEAGSPRLRLRQ